MFADQGSKAAPVTDAHTPQTGETPKAAGRMPPPAISLPKGGGAIRGMGEKFAANPVTGTGAMTVPIATSPGRGGFGPQLSLAYDSGAGNGPFGLGWSLSVPSITRKTDKGLPQYLDAEESDVFILSGAEDLVPLLNPDGSRFIDITCAPDYTIHRYRPRIEGLFARIEHWTRQSDGDVHWRSISRDNILTLYGKDSTSRIADPTDPSRIFSWLICETRDDKGNAVLYTYKAEDGAGVDLSQAHERNRGGRDDPRRTANRFLKQIRYGNQTSLLNSVGVRPRFLTDLPAAQVANTHWLFEVIFDYGEHDANAPAPDDAEQWDFRQDPFSTYRAGFEVRTTRLCQRVLMFHHFPDLSTAEPGYDGPVRSTDFTYSQEQDPSNARNPVYTFLQQVTQSGYKRAGTGYLKRSLPPVEFEYTQPVVQDTVQAVDDASLENLPIGLDGAAYQWTDLHGEGIPGILTEQGGAWFYKRNLSPINSQPSNGVPHVEAKFAPLEWVAVKPNLALAGGAQFMDLAGDGQPDLVVLDGPMAGFYEHDGAEGWQPFRPFCERLNRDTRDPNLKFIDLDGDGHADVLMSEDDAFVWHPSLAEAGFGPARRVAQALDEEQGPRLVFADGTQSIYLADLSGDGLTDLVRIRNGEVCYWPNLGYGHFGAKVTMDNAPWFDHPDEFDQQRIRLADIDGSGTTDIIYLHGDGVRLYFNQSGNSWGAPQPLRVFPRVDDLVSIVPADLLGNSTACLVWSSPLPDDTQQPMRYVDLMGGQKPHLLVKTVNNLGAETVVQYAPSTQFYLQDKYAGKPWITRLPFPVHVVERVETYDRVSGNRFVTRYAYHHGYFDGEEREFRGFGLVEQFDTEEFAALTADGALPAATNVDAASHVPPVLTKSWFHTGVYLERNQISTQLAKEYYGAPAFDDPDYANKLAQFMAAELLPDTVLPAGLSLDEEREACRALKGSMLRQEVYALDGTDKAAIPYAVTEQNFTIERLQPFGANQHAVFFTHPREAINTHYERNADDPRVSHALTLNVDNFGNVLQSAAIGYGRRQPDPALATDDQGKQGDLLITCTENDFTNPIEEDDDYRTPLPSESRTYELGGLVLATGRTRFSFNSVRNAIVSAAALAYEEPLTAGSQKRLIEHVLTRYRPNNLSRGLQDPLGLLPRGQLQSLALPGESYKLALTTGLVAQLYGNKVTDEMLADEGGYVHRAGEADWWIPAERIFFSPGSDDDAATELAHARAHFFLPHRFRDPFGYDTVVDYDGPLDPTLPRYDLLVTRTQDPLQNVVRAEHDYRLLQPWRITDPNGNRSEAAFDILGLVVGSAVKGKDDRLGDTLTGFVPDLTQAQLDGFYAVEDPHMSAPDLLQGATTRIVYDLDRFRRTQQAHPDDPSQWLPVYAATLMRETHVSEPLPPQGLAIQISFSYADGFGREIQQKIQAEPGPLAPGGPTVDPRWVGSGWTIFNNKGKPVRQYEPFFSQLSEKRHRFEFGVQVGVSPILFYDPLERVVATLHPNHTYEKVVFDPWQQTTYDGNDTVAANGAETGDPRTDPDIQGYVAEYFKTQPADWQSWYQERLRGAHGVTEQQAAEKAALHANTPTTAHFDTLGRPFLTLADNGVRGQYATRVELDIEGNQRRVIDALDRIVMTYDYDMLGNRIHQASMEAGERWMLNDVAGKPLYGWDSRDHRLRTVYDVLRRPTEVYLQEGSAPELLVGKTVYGESQSDPEVSNLRGKPYQAFDGAGVVTTPAYDFKGNPLHSSRQLAVDYKTTLDWSATVALEAEIFTASTSFDALNRPVQLIAPHSDQPGARRNVIQPVYNAANLLEGVDVWLDQPSDPATLLDATTVPPSTVGVNNIDYDAKGQRQRIDYKNNVTTLYTYDPETFRLVQLLTQRDAVAFPDDCPQPPLPNWPGCQVQNLHYTYDPVGNITHIQDEAQQTIYFRNQRVEPSADYIYDAIYQLIEATGREHIGQLSQPETTWRDEFRVKLPHPGDGLAMRLYTEQYEYDAVGNILHMIHQANNGNWTRGYAYNEDGLLEPGKVSNRLSSTQIGSGPLEPYTYDAHGSMITMPHLPLMEWDYRDQLQASAQQVRNDGGTPEITYYVYDAGGQRVRKVTERQAEPDETPTRMKERIYLSGFEIYREYDAADSTVSLERETLHIMDDKQRIALVETRTQGDDGSPARLVRYQLGNHLGSASLELDEAGEIISYEEYYPYGSTSYQAVDKRIKVAAKRYRYTGKERDEETGLAYHGARYYSCWLGRWTSVDPAGLIDGTNRYIYVRNRPTMAVDLQGTETFNAGELLDYETVDGVEYARYQAKEGTWISASMQEMGWDEVFAQEQGYGAYTGMVRDASGAVYKAPDEVKIGDQYLIPTMHQVFKYPEATITGTAPPAAWSLTDLLPDAIGFNVDVTASSGASLLGGLEINATPHGVTYMIPLKGPYWGQSIVLPYAGAGGSVALGESVSPVSAQLNLNPQAFVFSGDNANITPESKAGWSVGGSVGGELAAGMLGEAKVTASLDAPSDAGVWSSYGLSFGFGGGATESAELEAGANVTYSQLAGQYEPTADMSWADFLLWNRMRAAWNMSFGGLIRNTLVNNPITRGETPLYVSPMNQ
jgi:RHS repeat-associated protein